jgi:hypothetical protein
MALLAFLNGCSNGPTPPTPATHVVAAHGETMRKAQQRAARKIHCEEAQPRVTERRAHPKESTFASQQTPDLPPPDESSDLAATTHEGESPAVQLGFQCIPGS